MSSVSLRPELRDPAWMGRIFWSLAALVILAPMLVATEFKPWLLVEPDNLKVTLKFLGDFFPPVVTPDFLWMVAKESWRTIAIATAGTFLALVLAIPLTIASTSVLSVSSIPGRMKALPFVVRQAIRWVLIVLRSIPELIWALVFVRVVGLGPAAGVLAIGLTYAGMLGKVYGEILESGDAHATKTLLRTVAAGCRSSFWSAAQMQPS